MKKLITPIIFFMFALSLVACSSEKLPDSKHALPEDSFHESSNGTIEIEMDPGDQEACEIAFSAYNKFVVALNNYGEADGDQAYWEHTATERFLDQRSAVTEALEHARDSDLIDRLTQMQELARGTSNDDLAAYPQAMWWLEGECGDLGVEVEKTEIIQPDETF